MWTTIKSVIEIIKMVLDGLKFVTGEITEQIYLGKLRKRKNSYTKFVEGERADRLRVLQKENEAKK